MKKGTLIIKPTTGRLYRDTETFGKMDPFVTFQLGTTAQKTRTHESGGKTPCWSDTLSFNLTHTTELFIRVMDEDTCSDDMVGETRLNLDPIISKGTFKDWVTIHYKGKEAGQIFMEILYMPEGGHKPVSSMPPATAPSAP